MVIARAEGDEITTPDWRDRLDRFDAALNLTASSWGGAGEREQRQCADGSDEYPLEHK
jgi:hypothetical protein